VSSNLESLKQYTTVVADTGDINSILKYGAHDATTNPSLILNAARMPEYHSIVQKSVEHAQKQGHVHWIDEAIDRLSVSFGVELLKIVPGRVSTEVDASLSFSTSKTVDKARQLIALYASEGVSRDRVLIKIAASWEGIQAAEILEKEGINCNLTLIFSEVQAIACAEAGVFLISPFVGRILDWYAANTGLRYEAEDDPGVISVKNIYNYFKRHGYKTIVMGASFRNVGEILELCGCDRLTISPGLLEELSQGSGVVTQKLSESLAAETESDRIVVSEEWFRWSMNESPMATEKLAEGIRKFNSDLNELRSYLRSRFSS